MQKKKKTLKKKPNKNQGSAMLSVAIKIPEEAFLKGIPQI